MEFVSGDDDLLMDRVVTSLVWTAQKGRKWEAPSMVAHYLVREKDGFFTISMDGMPPLPVLFDDLTEAKAWAFRDAKSKVFYMPTPTALVYLKDFSN